MENINQENNSLPKLEQSTDERLISYGIYKTDEKLYPYHKYVLLKFISFRPSTIVQRDEGFAILLNDIDEICFEIVSQGLVMFARRAKDTPSLVFSFMSI